MTTSNVDWKQFKGLVENSLEKAELSRHDLPAAFTFIREIVNSHLDIYIDTRFIDQFRTNLKTVGRIIHIELKHDTEILCQWEVSCQA